MKIDKILQTNIVTKDYFNKCIVELYSEGAYKCKKDEKIDLKTTFMIYSLLTNHEIFEVSNNDIGKMKKELEKLNVGGLYRYELIDGYKDFRSIYYGYTLKKLDIGEGDAKQI